MSLIELLDQLQLSDDYTSFTFAKEPIDAAEMLKDHDDGYSTKALTMVMNQAVQAPPSGPTSPSVQDGKDHENATMRHNREDASSDSDETPVPVSASIGDTHTPQAASSKVAPGDSGTSADHPNDSQGSKPDATFNISSSMKPNNPPSAGHLPTSKSDVRGVEVMVGNSADAPELEVTAASSSLSSPKTEKTSPTSSSGVSPKGGAKDFTTDAEVKFDFVSRSAKEAKNKTEKGKTEVSDETVGQEGFICCCSFM